MQATLSILGRSMAAGAAQGRVYDSPMESEALRPCLAPRTEDHDFSADACGDIKAGSCRRQNGTFERPCSLFFHLPIALPRTTSNPMLVSCASYKGCAPNKKCSLVQISVHTSSPVRGL
eukprot:1559183-Pleurochrysis_carterae.AAC.1